MKSLRSTANLVALFLGILAILTRPALPQGLFGTIGGLVADPSGAVIPGATVIITNVATNIKTTVASNSVGVYSATSLNPGTYKVEAEVKGFKRAVATNIGLEVNANVTVNLVLEIGQPSETIQVSESATPVLETQQSDLGQTVDSRQLDVLPVESSIGRNVYSLIYLSAGVSKEIGGGGGDNDLVRINGDRPRDQDYLLDGTSVVQPVFGGQALNPSVDSIQEFRVEANTMSAEYGQAGGGVLIAVTKSGTNQFHGSAYEYNRNEHFDARNFFNEDPSVRKNPYNYNEFGGTISGPVLKNKLFFFTDYQGIREHGSQAVSGQPVPDAAFRSGDLSALCPGGFDATGNCLSGTQIHFPGTTTPVPFNKITSTNPISQALVALYPTSAIRCIDQSGNPIPGCDLVNLDTPFSNTLNRFNPRIDFNLSNSDRIFGAFHRESGPAIAYDLVVGPAGEQISQTDDYSTSVGWTHTFNSSTLDDFRFGTMHRVGDRATYGQGFRSPADFGIKGIPNCLSSVPNTDNGTKCGTPGVSINGYYGLPTGLTLYEPVSILQFSNTLTKMMGRHSVKTGAEFRHYAINNYQPNQVVGAFAFQGGQTGNAFADFLFGALSSGSFAEVQNAMVESRAWNYAGFVQDDLKLSRRLTVNLGLRYQWDSSFHELHNGNAFFNPYTAKWEQFGVNAPPTAFDNWSKEFGPRVGFAWNPADRFVVHGGYGIMFPGYIGHGRAGDGQPGPNLLATTPFNAGVNWSSLPAVTNPDPSAITAPIPVNGNVSFSAWAPRHQTPTYIQLWNLTLERQFGSDTVIRAGYVGSHGTHLPINYAYNICQQSRQSLAEFGKNATTSPYCSAQAAQLAGIWNLVVTPGWWGLSSSVYHSFQATLDRRFSRGFSVLANFTWSKLLDDSSSDWGGFWSLDVLGQDFYDRRAERSVSAGDVPVRFTIAPIYELPVGRGKKWLQSGPASQVLGGWRVAGIYTASDGYPFGITDNSYGYCNFAHMLTDRPNLIGNPLPAGFHQTIQSWFNTGAFDFSGTCPASGLVNLTGPGDPAKAFGNAPRYFSKIRVPGISNLDFSLQKDFQLPVRESTRLAFRADFFNLVNHPQLGAPASDPTQGNFGTINSTALNNRTIQLGLHLYF
jgi:carboxypeptidase family protein/TonB-dependent receptor-like protein